jgi:hypothetical protein
MSLQPAQCAQNGMNLCKQWDTGELRKRISLDNEGIEIRFRKWLLANRSAEFVYFNYLLILASIESKCRIKMPLLDKFCYEKIILLLTFIIMSNLQAQERPKLSKE